VRHIHDIRAHRFNAVLDSGDDLVERHQLHPGRWEFQPVKRCEGIFGLNRPHLPFLRVDVDLLVVEFDPHRRHKQPVQRISRARMLEQRAATTECFVVRMNRHGHDFHRCAP
jgi:hypothetical protein